MLEAGEGKGGEEKAKRMLLIESSQGRYPRGCSDSSHSSSHMAGGRGGGGEHSQNPSFESRFCYLVDADAGQVTPCLGASRASSVCGGNNAYASGLG